MPRVCINNYVMSQKFIVEGGLSIPSGKFLELGGTELSASATELNLLDGMTAISTDANLGTSDTTLASQAAIKSYVDAQLGASVLTFTTDTEGNNTVDLDDDTLTFAGLSGVGVTHDGDTITIAMDDLNSFSTTDLSEGTNLYYTDTRARAAVSVTDNGGDGSLSYDSSTGEISYTGPSAAEVRAHLSVTDTDRIDLTYTNGDISADIKDDSVDSNHYVAGSIDNEHIADATIANAKLVNDSVSFGGVEVDLGAADATPAFDLTDATAYPGDASLVTTGALDSGSITSGFGSIDIGTSTLDCGVITSTGASSMETLTVSTSAILADGSQLASSAAPTADNDIANKKYVDDQLTGADLDFTSDGGESLSIDLDSETLTVAGGSNLTTSAADNTITVALDDDVTISGDMTSATITNAEFTVDASGNTDIDGTLNVEGVPTFQAQSVHSSGIDCNGTLSMGTNAIEGTADNMLIFADDSTSSGSEHSFANDDDGVLALQAVDHIRSLNDFIPNADSSVDLGSSDKRWAEVHADKMAMEHCEKRDFSVAMTGSAVEVADLTGFESGKIVLKVKDSSDNITSKEILAVNGSFVEYATITSGTEVEMTITVSGNSVRVNSANGTAKGSVDLIK